MATFTSLQKNPLSWLAPIPVVATAEVDFLFSDNSDFLFSDSSDYIFSESVTGRSPTVWSSLNKSH